jgi:hypothetical protein
MSEENPLAAVITNNCRRLPQPPQQGCFAAVVYTPLKGGYNHKCRTHTAPLQTGALACRETQP